MNKSVTLFRVERSEQGTIGLLTTNGFMCYTIELPWNDNMRQHSCIPAGEYNVDIRQSPKYGRTYHVKEVPNRSYILIHSGNYGGDGRKGYKTHTMGCILPGYKTGYLGGQRAVLSSRTTVRRFMSHMGYQPFTLKIMEALVK